MGRIVKCAGRSRVMLMCFAQGLCTTARCPSMEEWWCPTIWTYIYIYNDLSKCIRKIQRELLVLFVKENLLHNLLSFTSRAVSNRHQSNFSLICTTSKDSKPQFISQFQRVDENWQPSFGPKKRPSLDQKKTHGQPLGHVDPQHLGQVADVDKMLMYSTAPAEEISSPRLLATQGIAWRETLQATKGNNGRYMLIYIYI